MADALARRFRLFKLSQPDTAETEVFGRLEHAIVCAKLDDLAELADTGASLEYPIQSFARTAQEGRKLEGNIVLLLRQTVSYHNREQLQETFRSYCDRHDRHLNRLQELEQVRRRFKNQQFEGANSTFSNGAVIGAVLNEFLRGMATSPELWSTIQRQQQPRWTVSDPNLGSGGFSGNFGGA